MAAVQTYSSSDMGRRIDFLARPKRYASGFQLDRRTVYWVEQNPPVPNHDGVTIITASDRVQELAQPKSLHKWWTGDRSSPEWPVSKGARQTTANKQVCCLAQHKEVNPNHRMERSTDMKVSRAALSGTASDRLLQLAVPKRCRSSDEVVGKEWGQYVPVSAAALKAEASERIALLAESKKYHKDFQGEKPIQWPVSEGALKAQASLRLQQLSRPHSRVMVHDDFDPYKVSLAARKSHPTPRLDELATPLPRKMRSKRIM